MAPEVVSDEIRAELEDVDRMDSVAYDVGSAYMSKLSRSSYHRMNRKRGRTARPDDEGDLA